MLELELIQVNFNKAFKLLDTINGYDKSREEVGKINEESREAWCIQGNETIT